jgi:cell division protease FtsH
LQQATRIARAMVMQYGMSDHLALRTYGEQQGSIFLGRDMGFGRDYSEDAAKSIDEEVAGILDRNYDRAKQIVTEHKDRLIGLAETLKKVETLDRTEFEKLMNLDHIDDSGTLSEPAESESTEETSTVG